MMGVSGIVVYFLPSLIGPVGHGYVVIRIITCIYAFILSNTIVVRKRSFLGLQLLKGQH